jgi:hypothetical protein
MHDDMNAAGEPLNPKRNIEPRYDKLSQNVVDLNRAMFTLFVDFLAPSEPEHASQEEQTMLQNLCRATDKWEAAVTMQPEAARGPTHGRQTLSTSTASSTKRSSTQPKSSGSGRNSRITKEQNDRIKRKLLAQAMRQRVKAQAKAYLLSPAIGPESPATTPSNALLLPVLDNPTTATTTDLPSPPFKMQRQSSRPQPNKRFRYEPSAVGQGPAETSGLTVSTVDPSPSQLCVVDTGASHVLFRGPSVPCRNVTAGF